MAQYNINDDFGGFRKIEPTNDEIYKDSSNLEQDLEHLVRLLSESGDLTTLLHAYLSYEHLYQNLMDNYQPKITVTKKQTYLSAPTLQRMLNRLRFRVRNAEKDMIHFKQKIKWYYAQAKGKGTNTNGSFVALNYYKDALRKERKHLTNLVQQIKGLKSMLKDAV